MLALSGKILTGKLLTAIAVTNLILYETSYYSGGDILIVNIAFYIHCYQQAAGLSNFQSSTEPIAVYIQIQQHHCLDLTNCRDLIGSIINVEEYKTNRLLYFSFSDDNVYSVYLRNASLQLRHTLLLRRCVIENDLGATSLV